MPPGKGRGFGGASGYGGGRSGRGGGGYGMSPGERNARTGNPAGNPTGRASTGGPSRHSYSGLGRASTGGPARHRSTASSTGGPTRTTSPRAAIDARESTGFNFERAVETGLTGFLFGGPLAAAAGFFAGGYFADDVDKLGNKLKKSVTTPRTRIPKTTPQTDRLRRGDTTGQAVRQTGVGAGVVGPAAPSDRSPNAGLQLPTQDPLYRNPGEPLYGRRPRRPVKRGLTI